MKHFLFPAILILLVSCNSAKNDDTGTDIKNDSSANVTAPPDTTATTDLPSGKIDIESFGDIKLGQLHTETLRTLGEPASKTKAVEWGADGLMHEDWAWKDKGLELNMSSDKNNVPGTLAIFSITAKAPCTFKTKAGVGIGSSYAEVQEAYKRDIKPEENSKEQIVVGSVYGGIIFTFKNERVESIFLGAAAE
jgi:hypothetical protein